MLRLEYFIHIFVLSVGSSNLFQTAELLPRGSAVFLFLQSEMKCACLTVLSSMKDVSVKKSVG